MLNIHSQLVLYNSQLHPCKIEKNVDTIDTWLIILEEKILNHSQQDAALPQDVWSQKKQAFRYFKDLSDLANEAEMKTS